MKKILLIQPRSVHTFWNLSGVANCPNTALIPPPGLVTLAALTPPPQFEVEIIDEEVPDFDFDFPWDLAGMVVLNPWGEKRACQLSAPFLPSAGATDEPEMRPVPT